MDEEVVKKASVCSCITYVANANGDENRLPCKCNLGRQVNFAFSGPVSTWNGGSNRRTPRWPSPVNRRDMPRAQRVVEAGNTNARDSPPYPAFALPPCLRHASRPPPADEAAAAAQFRLSSRGSCGWLREAAARNGGRELPLDRAAASRAAAAAARPTRLRFLRLVSRATARPRMCPGTRGCCFGLG